MTVSRHVVVSTASGTGQAQPFYDAHAKVVFESLGLKPNEDYIVHVTESDQTIIELTKNVFLPAANSGITLSIILLSGDGGVVDAQR